MSVIIERKTLVDIARRVYSGKWDIEKKIEKSLADEPNFFKNVEKELWKKILGDHPWKDFTGKKESQTRSNIVKRIRTVFKSKSFILE